MTPQRDLGPYAARLARTWSARFGNTEYAELTGTLLKADVSGFTRLSERLSRTARTGAEEVNAVIDGLWTELISPLLASGGDVLQFGGDALAVWFEGEGHALRAVDAAARMHREVNGRPAEQTPAGRVRLRMSAGAESGTFCFGLVGKDHRELVVFGPATTAALHWEVLAEAGQTVVGPSLAAAVTAAGARVVPRPEDAGSIVRSAPRLPPHVPRSEELGDPAAFLDPQVLELERVSLPLGEHRRATVAFVQLQHLDEVVTRDGLAEAHSQVATVAAAIEQAVRQHDVCWLATDLAGDGVVYLLVSGAPRASEDDEERLLRVVRAVVDECAPLPVRAGIHSGRGFAGDVGHPERRTYAVLGDTTNTAARLMGSVGPGQIRISRQAWERSSREHAVTWTGTLTLKGRQQGVEAGLLGALTQGRRAATHDLPLIGRDDALTALADLLGGSGRPLLLLGPAGVGKSRLVATALESADRSGTRVLVTAADPYDSATAFGASRAALRGLLGLDGSDDEARVLALAGDHPALAPLLGLPLGVDLPATDATLALDPAFVPQQRLSLLLEALRRSVDGRLFVVAEDLQILDRATLELIDALAGTASVLGTGRTLPAQWPTDPGTWSRFDLQPLDRASARRLALEAAGDLALDDLQLDRVLAEADGNPLFLRELVLWAGREGGADVPDDVEQVIAARIDRLPPQHRALLRQVAVLGSTVDQELASVVLGDSSLLRSSAWAPLQDFLEPSPVGFRFRHDLYRRVAYDGLSLRRRRAVHATVAEQLEQRGGADLATLAQHVHAAQLWPRAYDYARLAAQTARGEGALGDALSLTATALESGRHARVDQAALADLEELLGDVADLLGRYPVADQAYLRSSRCGTTRVRLDRIVKRAAVVEREGRYSFALSLLSRVQRQTEDPALLRALELRRSSALFRCGRLVQSGQAAQRAVDLATDDRPDRARGLLRLEMVASELGLPERFALGQRALQAFEGVDEPRELGNLHLNLGVTQLESDGWESAVRHFQDSDAAYSRAGDRVGAAFALNNASEILSDQGHLDAAREGFLEARRIFRASGHALGAAACDSALGRVAARSGDLVGAQALLLSARQRLADLSAAVLAADAGLRLVEVALLGKEPGVLDLARAGAAAEAATAGGASLPPTSRRYIAVALAQSGDREGAAEELLEILERARTVRALYEVASALDHLDGLGRLQDTGRQERDHLCARLGIVSLPAYPLG